jgi:hypothetical protein
MINRRTMSHADWWIEGVRLYGDDPTKWRFRCVKCGGVQSVEECLAAGMTSGQSFFSCIGRVKPGVGCDWTLGGLFHFHTLEVVDKDGIAHPVFEFADEAIPTIDRKSAMEAMS